jgi:hypothetical protein
MRRSRIVMALAVPFGFVAGHAAGYGFAHHDHADHAAAMAGHGYFSSLTTVAVPLLLLSLGCAVWNGRRGERFDLGIAPMAAQLVTVFGAIELVEHLADGVPMDHILADPALWIGVVAQIAVAFLLQLLLRLLYKVGGKLTSAGAFHRGRLALRLPSATSIAFRPVFPTTISGRGPPRIG